MGGSVATRSASLHSAPLTTRPTRPGSEAELLNSQAAWLADDLRDFNGHDLAAVSAADTILAQQSKVVDMSTRSRSATRSSKCLRPSCPDGRAGKARPYALRHTFATSALAAGLSVFELARVMGTSVDMIDRTYGHLARGSEDHMRDRLAAYANRFGEDVAEEER